MNVLDGLSEFREILRAKESLAPWTLLKVGGAADATARPRSRPELVKLVQRCVHRQIPFRILGAGGNVLVRDEGIPGIVIRLDEPAFTELRVEGRRLWAGCGATLAALIAFAAKHHLTGLEALVGLPGTVGGALRLNAGERTSEIGQFVRQVEVLDSQGILQVRDHEDLRFGATAGHPDDPVLLTAEFELESDVEEAIVKRLRKAWIQRKATQPFSFESAGRVFQNPPGLNAAALIEQAGVVGTKVGGAHISERNANYVVAEPGTSTADVLRLIDQVRVRVREKFHLDLELAISIW